MIRRLRRACSVLFSAPLRPGHIRVTIQDVYGLETFVLREATIEQERSVSDRRNSYGMPVELVCDGPPTLTISGVVVECTTNFQLP